MAQRINIDLTAYNMGPEATEADYDAWYAYVCDHIDDALGLTIDDIDQFVWGRAMPAEDRIGGATEEQAAAIRDWLSHAGWDAFCGERGAAAA